MKLLFVTRLGWMVPAITIVGCASQQPNRTEDQMTPNATDRLVESCMRQNAADIFDARQERVQELITKYAGRLPSTAVRTSTPTSLASVGALMAEWNPIGFSVEDVEVLLGPPSESDPEKLVYRYNTGRGGASWHFLRTRHVVTGVIHFMGE